MTLAEASRQYQVALEYARTPGDEPEDDEAELAAARTQVEVLWLEGEAGS